jgi:hypothetical protein
VDWLTDIHEYKLHARAATQLVVSMNHRDQGREDQDKSERAVMTDIYIS